MSDVVIVGGGIIGLLTAREVFLSGGSVILVDRGQVAQESSWSGGGILSPLYPWRWSDGITQLAMASQAVYPGLCDELQQETGIDPQWIQNGLLVLETDEMNNAQLWSERYSVSMQVLSAEETCRVEPKAGSMPGALFFPEIGQVRNPRLSQSVKAWLRKSGVTVLENQEVFELVGNEGRIKNIITSDGQIYADQFVVAGGAWSRGILQSLDIEIDVQPVKGQMILYSTPPGFISRIMLFEDRYIIPRKDGHTLVGSTLEQAQFNKQVTPTAKSDLAAMARRIAPQLADFPLVNHWSGLRPGTHRDVPYVCRHPEFENLFINTGHFRNGVVTAPASARLMSELINGIQPFIAPETFAL